MALQKYRTRSSKYSLSIEDVVLPVTVGGINIAAAKANEAINTERVKAGKKALGPFLNVKSGIRYAQTLGSLGATILHKKTADMTRTIMIASIPQTMESLVDDVMAAMGPKTASAKTRAIVVTNPGGGSGGVNVNADDSLATMVASSAGAYGV